MWDTASGSWSSSLEASPFHGRIGNVENIIVIAAWPQDRLPRPRSQRPRTAPLSRKANGVPPRVGLSVPHAWIYVKCDWGEVLVSSKVRRLTRSREVGAFAFKGFDAFAEVRAFEAATEEGDALTTISLYSLLRSIPTPLGASTCGRREIETPSDLRLTATEKKYDKCPISRTQRTLQGQEAHRSSPGWLAPREVRWWLIM